MKKWVISITCACLVLGFLLSLQIRLQNSATLASTSDDKNDVLISLVKNNEAEIADYEATLTELRRQYEEMTAKSSNQSEVQDLQSQLSELQAKAGLTALEGPGVMVTLDDNVIGLSSSPQNDANYYIIHYQYILRIVNDLKQGGAEAISVNDQRLVTTSEIRCVGNTILVNTTRLAPPYEIRAIGDVLNLEDALLNSWQFDNLKLLNFPVSYKTTSPQDPKITIPAYAGSFSPKFLAPDTPSDTPSEEE